MHACTHIHLVMGEGEKKWEREERVGMRERRKRERVCV